MGEEKITLFEVQDGQERWIFEDWETALDHIRQGLLDEVREYDEYCLTVVCMSRAEYEALPVQ